MVVVAMAVVIMLVVVVLKVLVWAAAIINMAAVIGALAIDAGFIVVVIVVLPASYSTDVPSFDVDVDLFMDVLAGVMLGDLPGIAIEVFADVNANAFAVVTVLEFPVSTTPLEEFSS